MAEAKQKLLKPFPPTSRPLPHGWERYKLDDISERGSGHTPDQKKPEYWNGEIKWVSLADSSKLDAGVITKTDKKISPLGLRHSSAVLHPPGTVIVSRDAGVGKSAVLGAEMAVSQHFIAWNCDNHKKVEPWFLYAWLQNNKLFFEKMAVGSTIKTIGMPLFEQLTIEIPPITEQRKIAEILCTWDKAIEVLGALRAAKEQQFKGLCQNLLGRNGDFPEHWKRQPLSTAATRIQRTNTGGGHPIMTISAKSGFLMQSDKFKRDMAGGSIEKYIELRGGEFAYNKGNSLTAPYGCIFALDRPSALVPFVYYCFALDPILNHKFYQHLFAAGALNRQIARLINSGVRNDGLFNLDADDFFNCEIPVPPKKEQEKIVTVLTDAKNEIALIEASLANHKQQKRGLMQKLLTGEWRVTP